MNEYEWVEVVAVINGNWPHAPLPEHAVRIQATVVADVPKEAALRAVAALARDGERFPPSAGQIVARLATGRPRRTPEEGWALIADAVRRVGRSHNAVDFAERHQAAIDWLAEQDEVLAAYAARRGLVGPGTLGVEPVADPEFGGAVVHRLRGEIEECRKAAEVRVRAGLPAVEPRQLVVRSTGAAQGGMAGLLDRLRPAGQIEEG